MHFRLILMVMLLTGVTPATAVDTKPEPPPSTLREAQLLVWVHNLIDDDVRFNAMDAMDWLSMAGREAEPVLQAALRSPDHQQRQFAAAVLRDMPGAKPSYALMVVLVEALRADNIPYNPGGNGRSRSYTGVWNAVRSVSYLRRHIDAVEPLLAEAVVSEDAQQRFLSACILGWSGNSEYTEAVGGVLLPHLSDNSIEGDALMAASALYRLGPTVAPMLELARSDADRQAAQLIDLILLDFRDPPTTWKKLAERQTMHDITSLYHDPVYQFSGVANGFSGIDRLDR